MYIIYMYAEMKIVKNYSIASTDYEILFCGFC